MLSARRCVILLAFVVLSVPGLTNSLEAQPTASLTILPQTGAAVPGGVATASVRVQGSLPVSGLSFGILHGPSLSFPLSGGVVLGGDLGATRGGLGPEFLSIDLFANGFTFAAVINVNVAGVDLSPNVSHSIAAMSYDVSATPGVGSTSLSFTDILGTPPVALAVGMGLDFVEPPLLTNGSIFVSAPFERGDVNQNGLVTITDAIFILTQLFGNEQATCMDASDIDGDQFVTISDPIFLLDRLFNTNAPMPGPTGACGFPATPSTLGCVSFLCP